MNKDLKDSVRYDSKMSEYKKTERSIDSQYNYKF